MAKVQKTSEGRSETTYVSSWLARASLASLAIFGAVVAIALSGLGTPSFSGALAQTIRTSSASGPLLSLFAIAFGTLVLRLGWKVPERGAQRQAPEVSRSYRR